MEALRQQEENNRGREFLIDFFFKVYMAQEFFYLITVEGVVDNNYSF